MIVSWPNFNNATQPQAQSKLTSKNLWISLWIKPIIALVLIARTPIMREDQILFRTTIMFFVCWCSCATFIVIVRPSPHLFKLRSAISSCLRNIIVYLGILVHLFPSVYWTLSSVFAFVCRLPHQTRSNLSSTAKQLHLFSRFPQWLHANWYTVYLIRVGKRRRL